ncbi:TonB-dependent receptor plug domain-containing protein [Roseateles sp. UC29_93]|uniref:TonB-dependent receptor plug domain-containing protein n=1 Tax=Roseateles sp. UC29_93 TaxID=3350177 RepID=UPI00366B7F02
MKTHAIARACALVCLSALAPATAVLAQDAPPGLGNEPTSGKRLDRVEITGRNTDSELRRRAPVAKQIYGRDELDKYGDTSVADVLKRLPGVNVSDGAPRMRGLGSGYTLILINGDPAPPGFKLDQLDPAQVERIEVTKGPSADQSAQAVAGAINIILKEAPKMSQRDLRVGAGYNINHPVPSATFTYGERFGPVSVSVPLSAFQWLQEMKSTTERNGTDLDGQPVIASQHGKMRNWGHGFNSAPRATWKISDDETVSLIGFAQKGFWNNSVRLTPDAVYSPGTRLDDNADNQGTWQMLRANAQWNNRFSETQKWELKAGVQDAKNHIENHTLTGRPVDALLDSRDRSLTQAGKYSQILGEEHTLTVGWDFEFRKRDEIRNTLVAGDEQSPGLNGENFGARIRRQAFFIQDEWEINPQWSTYFGLRHEQIVTTSRGVATDARNSSSVLSPLWHLTYKLDPKGRDMIRASITRSYKAPELTQMLGRYTPNSKFPSPATGEQNDEFNPDRIGNPGLKPELATGFDVAYEKYLTGGSLFSVGLFHRNISQLIRNVVTLDPANPPLSTVPRYVIRPMNFSSATTSGIEMELKGRAGELFPSLFDPKLPLNLRSSVSVYRSRVKAVDGPDNRLDQQQPWTANLGFDYRFSSVPVTTGANLNYTPVYTVRQTDRQSVEYSRNRGLDVFAQWIVSPKTSVRFSANNLFPLDARAETQLPGDQFYATGRGLKPWFQLNLEMKL